jgi:hypothetical protein
MQNQRTVKRPMFACLGILGAARLPLAMFQTGCYRRQKTSATCESLYRLSSFVFVNLLSLIPTIFANKYSPRNRISRAQRFRGSLCYVVGGGALVPKRRATADALAWRARLWPCLPRGTCRSYVRARESQPKLIKITAIYDRATDSSLC